MGVTVEGGLNPRFVDRMALGLAAFYSYEAIHKKGTVNKHDTCLGYCVANCVPESLFLP